MSFARKTAALESPNQQWLLIFKNMKWNNQDYIGTKDVQAYKKVLMGIKFPESKFRADGKGASL